MNIIKLYIDRIKIQTSSCTFLGKAELVDQIEHGEETDAAAGNRQTEQDFVDLTTLEMDGQIVFGLRSTQIDGTRISRTV